MREGEAAVAREVIDPSTVVGPARVAGEGGKSVPDVQIHCQMSYVKLGAEGERRSMPISALPAQRVAVPLDQRRDGLLAASLSEWRGKRERETELAACSELHHQRTAGF